MDAGGQVFAPIHHTLKQVFPKVVPYSQHVPSFADNSMSFLCHGIFPCVTHLDSRDLQAKTSLTLVRLKLT